VTTFDARQQLPLPCQLHRIPFLSFLAEMDKYHVRLRSMATFKVQSKLKEEFIKSTLLTPRSLAYRGSHLFEPELREFGVQCCMPVLLAEALLYNC
jgi:hypothetical protein